MKKALLANLLTRTGLRSVAGRFVPWSGILCLNYHRIGRAADSPFDHGLWSAEADAFDAQVQFLKSRFDLVSPGDLLDIVKRGTGRHVLITFDDGYRDNFTTAFPILKRHGVAATFFVSTGFLDQPKLPWWDEIAWMVRTSSRDRIDVRPWVSETVVFDQPGRERAVRVLLRTYKGMPAERTPNFLSAIGEATGTGRFDSSLAKDLWMTWDMLREMRSAGMTIGGHTVNHPVLGRMPRDQQWAEIEGCKRRLVEELGDQMWCFSYPVGSPAAFDNNTRDCLRTAGFRFAFSYYGGYRRFEEWDDYDIRRVPVESEIGTAWFRSIVSLPQVFAR